MREHFAYVSRTRYGLNLEIYIGYMEGKQAYLLQNNEMVEWDGLEVKEPTIKLRMNYREQEPVLRSLVDGLIEHGIKPTKKLPDNNELTAIKYHLEDMRKIVFEDSLSEKKEL